MAMLSNDAWSVAFSYLGECKHLMSCSRQIERAILRTRDWHCVDAGHLGCVNRRISSVELRSGRRQGLHDRFDISAVESAKVVGCLHSKMERFSKLRHLHIDLDKPKLIKLVCSFPVLETLRVEQCSVRISSPQPALQVLKCAQVSFSSRAKGLMLPQIREIRLYDDTITRALFQYVDTNKLEKLSCSVENLPATELLNHCPSLKVLRLDEVHSKSVTLFRAGCPPALVDFRLFDPHCEVDWGGKGTLTCLKMEMQAELASEGVQRALGALPALRRAYFTLLGCGENSRITLKHAGLKELELAFTSSPGESPQNTAVIDCPSLQRFTTTFTQVQTTSLPELQECTSTKDDLVIHGVLCSLHITGTTVSIFNMPSLKIVQGKPVRSLPMAYANSEQDYCYLLPLREL